MPQQKPAAVVVVAVLQLTFGSMGMCLALVNLAEVPKQLAAASQQNLPPGQKQLSQDEIEKRLEQRFPHYKAMERGSLAASATLCLLMIGSGLGLLRMRPWGRHLAIIYAVLSILVTIFNVGYAVTVAMPLMSDIARDLAAQGGKEAQFVAQAVQISMVFGLVLSALLVVYPITVLVLMLLPSVRAAFGGETPRAEPEDYRDPIGPDDRFPAGGP